MTINPTPSANDPVLDVLDDVSGAVEDNLEDERDLLLELQRVREERQAGLPLRQAIGKNGRPRSLVLMGRIASRMTRIGARLQHTVARTLAHEGESVTSIARRFEVSHQRISTILRRSEAAEAPARETERDTGPSGES
jgi:CENP-B N-terminal DNA-binding domain